MINFGHSEERRIVANQNFKEKTYWLNQLAGEWVKGSFPYDYMVKNRDSKEHTRKSETIEFEFDESLTSRIMNICGGNDYTLHILLTAGLALLLNKFTGIDDIILGTPIYKQETHNDLINTFLVVRIQLNNEINFKNLLMQVKEILQEAVEHQNYPMEILAEQMKMPVFDDNFPLFDTAILLENIHDPKYLQQLQLNLHLIFSFFRINVGSINGKIEYNPLLYRTSIIERIISDYIHLLKVALSEVTTPLLLLNCMTKEERDQLLFDFNGTSADYQDQKSLHLLFEEQVVKSPDGTAVVDGNQYLSYNELNRRANQLARLLRRKGIGPDKIVGILMDNSLDMVVGILGILKAGGAYLPMGIDLPEHRIISMLNDSNIKVFLTKDKLICNFKYINLKNFEEKQLKKIMTPKRPQVMQLDTLQFPNRSLVDYDKYHPYIGQSMVKNSITVQFSRGCIFKCLYCFKIWPDKYSSRSGENLFEEVNMYYKLGIRRFGFTDDLPNFNKKEIGKFYQLVIKNKLKIHMHYPNGIRGDILTPDFIDLMMEAGAVTMDLALETASPRLQKLIRKNVNIERLRSIIDYIIQKYPQAILGVQIMHGFPTETEEEAKMTLEFIKSFRWLPFGYMHILKIYPNTDMARFAIENGISGESILKSMDLGYHELPYTLPFTQNFTRQCQTEYLGEFFLNKERLIKVLPNQMSVLQEDELVQKYNSYLPVKTRNFLELLNYIGISPDEIKGNFLPENYGKVENFNDKVKQYFPIHKSSTSATRLLLLDLSQHFTNEKQEMYHVVDPPLGLMYLLTHLNKVFGEQINGKIAKSQVDFVDYLELKNLVDDFMPHVIGIRSMNYFRNFCHKAIELIRQWGFSGPIIAGGPYATSSWDTMLQDTNIDLAVLEEGEITMAELMRTIMNNDGKLPCEEVLKTIPGIAFIDKYEKALLQQANRNILLMEHLTDGLAEEPSQNLEPVNKADDLAYIIYTSGSTGIPKGVMVQHRNIVNQLTGLKNKFHLDNNFNYLLLAAYTFDVSVMHLFSALTTGSKIFLLTEEIKKDPLKLWPLIHDNKINILNIVPAFMNALLENIEKNKISFKYLFVGGDVFTPDLYVALKETFRTESILNIYGPTETTINAALYTCDIIKKNQRIPIGKPLTNYSLYILDTHFNPVPVGGQGELCISGKGVARGYLNRPQLTADKFLHDPFIKGKTMYCTGDYARWLPDGNIEFLGRIDHQVKVRGYRIELEEIEKCLQGITNIEEAVVLIKEDESGDKYLSAYFVSNIQFVVSQIKDYLISKLPDYMVPTYIIQVDKMPLTSSGKIDKRKLLESKFKVSGVYVPPTNDLEHKLVEIWSDVLERDKKIIGINSNFFELGGHSLKATILISRIHKQMNTSLPLIQLFKTPTIKGLANYIKDTKQDEFISIEPVAEKECYVLSSAQKRLYTLYQLAPNSIGYNLFTFMTLIMPVDKKKLEETFIKLIARHESLRTSFVMKKEPMQKIYKNVNFHIEHYNANDKNEVEKIIQNFTRPFDLVQAPLMRVGLVGIDDSNSVLLVDMHHIITDGISQKILKSEFIALYNGEKLSPLRIQYKDYSEWQYRQMKTNSFKQKEEYWLGMFQGSVPVLDIPTDYPRPVIQSFEGSVVGFELNVEETNALRGMASKEESTLFMVLLAIYFVFLSKICSQEDIVVGTPIAGRRHADLEKIIGMFVNMLALRNFPHNDKKFIDFLHEVKQNTIKAFENQDYPFDDLVEKVVTKREPGRSPLFDVSFTLETLESATTSISLEHTQPALSYQFEGTSTIFDLAMYAFDRGERLVFFVQYSTKLFEKETIDKLVEYFKSTTSAVIKSPGQKIAEINIINESTMAHLLGKMRDENYDFIEKAQPTSDDTTKLEADFDY